MKYFNIELSLKSVFCFFINKNKLLYDFYKEAAGFTSINLYLNVQKFFPFLYNFLLLPSPIFLLFRVPTYHLH